jgi:pyridoxamine 5'-phosphate oxidase family protein
MARRSFSAAELDYLSGQRLGRLATVDAHGAPQNVPTGFFVDDDARDIVIGGTAMGRSRKFRNFAATCVAAFVVDDIASTDPWTVRGVEVRGHAQAIADVDPPMAGMSREVIRITPDLVRSWGLEPDDDR